MRRTKLFSFFAIETELVKKTTDFHVSNQQVPAERLNRLNRLLGFFGLRICFNYVIYFNYELNEFDEFDELNEFDEFLA
jgi:hypothetical protein